MEGSKRSMERQEAKSMNSEQKQRISRNHNSTSKVFLGRSRRNQETCNIWMESCGCLVSKSFGIVAIQVLRKGVMMETMAGGQSAGNRTDFAEVVYRVRECISSPKSFPSMPND